jgi:hypothetical protein
MEPLNDDGKPIREVVTNKSDGGDGIVESQGQFGGHIITNETMRLPVSDIGIVVVRHRCRLVTPMSGATRGEVGGRGQHGKISWEG